MKNKKRIALLMAALMSTSCLFGCGQTTTNESETQKSSESVTGTSTETASSETVEEKSLYNVGSLPIVNEEITLRVLTQDSAYNTYTRAADAGMWEWLEEQTGIHFEVESYSAEELKQKLPLIMSTPDDMPDLFIRCDMTDGDILQYGSNGQLLMLDDYIEEYGTNIKEAFDTLDYAYGAAASADGHIYALPAYNASASHCAYSMNSRFLENAGVEEVPTTLEELYEAFKAMKASDANGDGIVGNEIMWSSQTQTFKREALSMVGIACYWPWQGCIFDAKDDEVYFVPTSEEYKYLLGYLNKFYTEGMLDNEIFTQTTSEWSAKVDADLVFMGEALDDPEASNFKGRTGYFYAAPLTSAVSEDPFYVVGAPYQTGIGSIAANTEYPEVCVLLLDYLFSEDASKVSKWGLEGVDYKVVTEEPWILDRVDPEVSITGGPTSILMPRWLRDEWIQPADTTLKKERDELVAEYGKMGWQNYVHFTTEESDQIAVLSTDLGLFCDDYYVGFITGEYDLEKDWDEYVKQCNSMKLDELTDIYQAAYNRYYGLD